MQGALTEDTSIHKTGSLWPYSERKNCRGWVDGEREGGRGREGGRKEGRLNTQTHSPHDYTSFSVTFSVSEKKTLTVESKRATRRSFWFGL